MEKEDQTQSSGNGEETRKLWLKVAGDEQRLAQRQPLLQPGAEDKLVLQCLDSMHHYLILVDALSSTLRRGWLELASARHSMGASRINSSLLDLKFHSAATSLKITRNDGMQPCFMLCKWVSSEHENSKLEDENLQPQDGNSQLEDENLQPQDSNSLVQSSGLTDDDQIQKERSKSLSVFGILISPKLRATQLSFERALETLVELANMQSSLQYSFRQLHQQKENDEG